MTDGRVVVGAVVLSHEGGDGLEVENEGEADKDCFGREAQYCTKCASNLGQRAVVDGRSRYICQGEVVGESYNAWSHVSNLRRRIPHLTINFVTDSLAFIPAT
jgi:hypothetical protein